MIITCKNCYTKFNLDENLLKQTGSKVRCSKCQNIFVAYLPAETEKPAKPTEKMVGSETEEKAKAPLETEKEVEADLEIKEEELLDLSDIEKTLGIEETPEPETVVKEEPEEIDFELDLDTEPVAEKTPEEAEADLEIKEEELLDLSDIEKTLGIEETPEPETVVKEEPEEIDFELDLDTEPVAEKTPEEAEADLEFELEDVDLSDIEKTLGIEETPEPETVVKEEPEEIDFELEDVDEKKIKKEATETVDLGHQADQIEKEEVVKVKKRISTPVLVVLIIALFMGGSYWTYMALKSMNIKIPFISNLVKPAVQDEVGNLKIIVFDTADKFIDNPKSGKLFIISGKVKNEYSEVRSFIRVTGKLYSNERVLSKTATIYCGNVLSDQELLNMDMDSINKRLLTPFGDNKSNVNVKPGKPLQFMLVFPDVPDTIKEYTLEVAGSSPAKNF